MLSFQLGFITDAQLRLLYGMTELFVFPSFYEGFGFPILEAFCCAAPVITSTTSSCAEIAADAAKTVDPQSVAAMAEAMEQVLTDRAMNSALRQAGLRRARDFSFEKMARGTLDLYQNLVNSSGACKE